MPPRKRQPALPRTQVEVNAAKRAKRKPSIRGKRRKTAATRQPPRPRATQHVVDVAVKKIEDLLEAHPHYEPIFDIYLTDMIERFAERATDYGDTYMELGSKGQFSDMSRKMGKLKRAVWEGKRLQGEQVPEILDDIISHALLLRLCYEEGI